MWLQLCPLRGICGSLQPRMARLTDQVRGSHNPPPALPECPWSRYGARGWEWTVTKPRLPPKLLQQACRMTTGHSIKQIKKGMDRNAKPRPFVGSLVTQRNRVVSSNLAVSLVVTHAAQSSYLHMNLSARTCLEPRNQSPQPLWGHSDTHRPRHIRPQLRLIRWSLPPPRSASYGK